MSTMFGFFPTSSIIVICSIILCLIADFTFQDQLPHGLTKRQIEGETSCAIPAETPDKIYSVTELNGNPIENARHGLRVSKGAYIELRCVRGYSYDDGTNSSKSFCSPNGKWHPEIKSCLRICDPLQRYNVDLTCRFNEREIDCNRKLLSGTIVTPRCKELHHPSQQYDLEYTSIRCKDNGRWDNPLFKCIPDCGKPALETLLADGENSTLGQSPWHVAIFSLPRKAAEPLICGGTLITTNVVLTAAHCFYDRTNKAAKKNPDEYEIAVAKITRNRTKVDNQVQRTLQVSEIIFYDKPYNPDVTGYVADIALVILKESITVSPEVLPACFRGDAHRGFNPGAGAPGLLAGWGLDENGKPSQVLKTIKIPFINYTECVKTITVVTVDKFCAGTVKGPRPLKGDSGGGLMFKDPNRNLYFVRGIVSASDKFADQAITTFTDISYYLDWIDKILLEKKGPEKPTYPDESGSWTIKPSIPEPATKNYCETPLIYRGCYDLRPKSSLLNNRNSYNHTTPEACVEFCTTWEYPFAGIANQECLCGQHVPSDLLKRGNSECNYPCQGSCHKTLTCGGKSKVSVYETGLEIVQQISSRFYLGCFKDDNPNARVLNGTWNPFYNDNSPHKCHQHCFNTGFRYFGLTFFHECFCGDTNPALKDAKPESECSNACTGNTKEVCGGGWRLSVYATGITDYPEVGRLLGCYKNLPSSELKMDIRLDIIPLSNRRCLNFCTFNGYKYSAALKGNVCGCTNTQPPPTSLDSSSNCEKQSCAGDPTEMCGDADRVKVYRTRLADTTAPENVKYAGCYEDRNDIRVIGDYQVPLEESISGELCAEACRNKEFAFASLDAAKECFCGHTYPPPYLLRSESKCKLPCQNSSNESCEVSTKIAVYETGLQHDHARVSMVYLGCLKFEDGIESKPLKGSTQTLKNNSPDVCHRLCLKTGFLYFALTQANICSCGDEDPTTGQLQPETECIKECSGDANKRCGNETLFSVYKTGLEDVETKSLGCYLTDERSLREYSVVLPASNTPARCSRICHQLGFPFTGTENGNICRCGNERTGHPPEKDKAKCSSQCSGSAKETCGGDKHVEIFSLMSHNPVGKCNISDTTRNGKPTCRFETMLDENFNTLNSSRWKYSVKMAGDPDYEFVTYSKSPKVVFAKNGKLNIQPTLWLDSYTRDGKETLSGCTGIPDSDECTRTASSTNILPPVLSAQITTADSLSFRYGRLEIRAKLPSGDWIVPQIWLTPKEPAYGPKYRSGQIRIAYVRGNKNLQCDKKEMGSRTLQSGIIFGVPSYTVILMGRNESAEEWSKNFHNYSLVWTKENLSFFVDGKLLSRFPQHPSETVVNIGKIPQNIRHIWPNGSRLAPFDKEFYITLGVSVGGFRDFPDNCSTNGSKKPWNNTLPSKAMLDFWKKRDEWKRSWSGDGTALQVDHVKVAAL